MLNKIFKTFFILSICFGVSISSNAAVSVSDGSAFMTKAELAADLNNLSNRMAQLENSLDAKIDSLVSNYPSKNGIWSGTKQLTNSNVDDILPANVTLSSGSAQINTSLASGTYINNINKSGMLVSKYSYRNKDGVNSNSTRWGYSGLMKLTSNHCSDNGVIVSLYIYENIGGMSTQKFSQIILNFCGKPSSAWNADYYNLYAALPANEVYGNVLFFVNKGSSITYEVKQIAHFYYTSTVSRQQYDTSTLHFQLYDDAYVY